MNKLARITRKIFMRLIRIVEILVGVGLIIIGLACLGSRVPTTSELNALALKIGLMCLFLFLGVIILWKPKNVLLNLIPGILFLPVAVVCIGAMGLELLDAPGIVIIGIAPILIIMILVVIISFSRAYLFWRQRRI